jgi:predicted DNA-binding protein (MmcQ/YjbR family)
MARAKWVQVARGHALPAAGLDALVRRSHALVAGRLPKARQRELGLTA